MGLVILFEFPNLLSEPNQIILFY